MTAPTPCRGQAALYDAATTGQVHAEKRHQARLMASALCSRCPVAGTCPDRITRPARPPRARKANTMTDTPPPAAQPAPQPVPAAEPTSSTEALIAWGAAHRTNRIQSLAARARSSLTELQQACERDLEVTQAEARVERLRTQLAKAEKDLRSAKGITPAAKTGAQAPDEGYPAIRAWARENGHQVGDVGVPRRAVIAAYHAAQQAVG